MNKRGIAIAGAVVIAAALTYGVVFAGRVAGSEAEAPRGDAAHGKTVYMGTCVMCHGTNARGVQGLGPDLVVKSDWMKQQSDAALVKFIMVGRGPTRPDNVNGLPMLPRGGNPDLTENDIVDVVAYLRTLQKK